MLSYYFILSHYMLPHGVAANFKDIQGPNLTQLQQCYYYYTISFYPHLLILPFYVYTNNFHS